MCVNAAMVAGSRYTFSWKTYLTSHNLPIANKLIAMLCRSEEKDVLFDQISSRVNLFFEDLQRLADVAGLDAGL
jgi:hypothetical protein